MSSEAANPDIRITASEFAKAPRATAPLGTQMYREAAPQKAQPIKAKEPDAGARIIPIPIPDPSSQPPKPVSAPSATAPTPTLTREQRERLVWTGPIDQTHSLYHQESRPTAEG